MIKRTTIKQIVISVSLFIGLDLLLSIGFDVLAMSLSPAYYAIADEYTHPLVTISALVIALIVTFSEYVINKVRYTEFFKNNAENIKSSINIFTNKRIRMYKKASAIFQEYLTHEKGIHTTISKDRHNQQIQIGSAMAFHQALENYPDLKGNESVAQLLRQMESAENESTEMKQIYNNNVALYNESLSQISIKLFTRNKRMNFYEEELLEDDFI